MNLVKSDEGVEEQSENVSTFGRKQELRHAVYLYLDLHLPMKKEGRKKLPS